MARYKITNLISAGVAISDLGIHLPGKGSFIIVDESAKEKSKDIKQIKNWVRIEPVIEDRVPIWPFTKEAKVEIKPKIKSEPKSDSEFSLEELTQSVKKIEQILIQLLNRPSPPPPEIIAAHIKSIDQIGGIPRGLPGAKPKPGPGVSQDPIYIPSRIKPEIKDGGVLISSKDMATNDIDQNINLLKEMRKKNQ